MPVDSPTVANAEMTSNRDPFLPEVGGSASGNSVDLVTGANTAAPAVMAWRSSDRTGTCRRCPRPFPPCGSVLRMKNSPANMVISGRRPYRLAAAEMNIMMSMPSQDTGFISAISMLFDPAVQIK